MYMYVYIYIIVGKCLWITNTYKYTANLATPKPYHGVPDANRITTKT